jgi:exodeoxyribonuclease VII small subunit
MENKSFNFEESLKRIDIIMKELESNDLDIDKQMKLFKEGMELTSACSKKLNDIQAQATSILEENDINKLKEGVNNES